MNDVEAVGEAGVTATSATRQTRGMRDVGQVDYLGRISADPAALAALETAFPLDAVAAIAAGEEAVAATIEHFAGRPKDQDYLRHHARRIVLTTCLIPRDPPPGAAAVDLASYAVIAAYARSLGYEVEATGYSPDGPREVVREVVGPAGPESFASWDFDVEVDRFPYPAESFDLVVCGEMLEHMAFDPMHLLVEINRITKPGGLLILTTPNIASTRSIGSLLDGWHPYQYVSYRRDRTLDRHHVEWTVREVELILRAAGFEPDVLTTLATWDETNSGVLDLLRQLDKSTEMRDDNIFARARKTTADIERYPHWVYDEGPSVRYRSDEEPDYRLALPVSPPREIGIGAYRAHFELLAEVPKRVSAGATFTVSLRVTNDSGVDWRGLDATPPISLGWRWHLDEGVIGEGRVEPMPPLGSGEVRVFEVSVVSPQRAGRYELEFDAVHETVRWFGTGAVVEIEVASP